MITYKYPHIMKAKESLFLLLSGITAFTVLMTGCVKQPDYSGPDDNGQGGETDSITPP